MEEIVRSFFENVSFWQVLLGASALMFLNAAIMMPPSEYVCVFAGASIGGSAAQLFSIVIAMAVANLLGTSIWYWLGRHHGNRNRQLEYEENPKSIVERIRKVYFGRLKKIEVMYESHGTLLLFTLRVVPVIRSICSYPAGRIKISFTRFSLVSFGGISIWVSIWTILGFALGVVTLSYGVWVAAALGVVTICIALPLIHYFSKHV